MEINQALANTPLTAPETPPPATSALSTDFDTFLKMLTVQMENQDPLNPIESSDFAMQLATFSGVEQQIRTNELLETMVGGDLAGLLQIALWVGMEARAPVAAAWDGTTPVALYPEMPIGTDEVTLVTLDEFGQEVARTSIPVSDEPLYWIGSDADGAILPPGYCSFEIEAREAGSVIAIDQVEVYALVSEAQLVDGVPQIVFASGDKLSADDITAIRLPGT